MAGLIPNWQNGFKDQETGRPLSFMESVGLGKNDPDRFGRMAMLGNAVTVGGPGNFMEGVPQAFALGHELEQRKQANELAMQDRERKQQERQATAELAISQLPPNMHSYARAAPEMALKIANQNAERYAKEAEDRALLEYVDANYPHLSSFARVSSEQVRDIIGQKEGQAFSNFRQLTDPNERAALGIDPADTNPYQIGPDGKIYKIGGGGVTVNNNTGGNQFQRDMGSYYANMASNAFDAANAAHGQIGLYDSLGGALSNSGHTGAGAEQILELRKLAGRFGWDDLEGVGDAELAQSLGGKLALELRSPAGGAGMPGAMSDKDREFLVQMAPGLSKTPEGNAKLIEYAKRVENRKIEVARFIQQKMNENDGVLDHNIIGELQAWSEANPLFPEADQQTAAAGDVKQSPLEVRALNR